jgi:hypothetical protein
MKFGGTEKPAVFEPTEVPAAATDLTALAAVPAQAAATVDGSIRRSEVLARAQYWVNKAVVYSQERSVGDSAGRKYRTDCSGYVSLAWNLGTSLDTKGFSSYSRKIVLDSVHDLKPGDAILREGHIELFAKWKDPSDHTDGAYVYSLNGPPDRDWAKGPGRNTHGQVGFNTWGDMTTYKPIRYTRIQDDPPPVVTPVEGHLYREPDGTIAVIVGGAPARFQSMAELAAAGYSAASCTSVPAGWLNDLPQDPQNGSYLRNYADGSIYVIAGAAKYGLSLPEYNAMGRPLAVNVPVHFIAEFGPIPLDGSHLRNPADTSVYVVAGGAKYGLTLPQYDALGRPAATNVPIGFINTLSDDPLPGTHLRNRADTSVYLTVGGAKYGLSWEEYNALGHHPCTNVPIEWINSFKAIPADGSYLRNPDDGSIYAIENGKKRGLSYDEWLALGKPASTDVPVGFLNTIPTA